MVVDYRLPNSFDCRGKVSRYWLDASGNPVVSQNQIGTKVSDAGRLAAGEARLYRGDLGA
jgi:hypothetical protein